MSHTPWDGADRPTWATNVTLAHEAGLSIRSVERALRRLREAGLLSTPTGKRPGAKRRLGRILVPVMAGPARVLIPDRGAMANIWITCREARPRPASLVTLTAGIYALVADHLGRAPEGRAGVPISMADLRRFVGARKGHAFRSRLADLERLGIIERADFGVTIDPRAWWQSERAMESVRDLVARTREPSRPAFDDGQWEEVPNWF